MITIKRSFKIFAIFLITSCAVPGIDSPGNSFFGGTPVFYNGNELTIPIININKGFNDKNKYSYIISNGDVISMIIWGQDEAFPLTGGVMHQVQSTQGLLMKMEIFLFHILVTLILLEVQCHRLELK